MLLFSLAAVAAHRRVVRRSVPALQTSKPDVTDALKAAAAPAHGTDGAGAPGTSWWSIEVALSVVLLVSAGLTVRTFLALQRTDPGIRAGARPVRGRAAAADEVHTLERRNHFAQELLARVAALPGVEAATSGCRLAARRPRSRSSVRARASRDERINLTGADHSASVRRSAARAGGCSTRPKSNR